MANVTFLGTGLMGAALAEAAAKRGDRVTAWNRTAEKAKALEVFGVRAASSVCSLSGKSVVWSPITSSLTKSVCKASRASRAVRIASSAV